MILRLRHSLKLGGNVGQHRRGVALLLVLISITIMSTAVLEFLFSSRVKLALAVNARDEVKAYYNARSGINLLRLSLAFQYELGEQEGLIGRAVEQSNFQLWSYLQIMLPTFVTAELTSPVGSLDLEDTGAMGFGNLEGDIIFYDPEPEEGKINLNGFSGNVLEQEALLELCALFAPPQYDSLFEDDPENEVERVSRGELIGAIIDYVDSDSDRVEVDEDCQIIPSGSGAEDRRYRDQDYQSKNEPFTTLDEVLLVPGMSPEILDVFRDNLTVYAVAGEFYVNLADAQGFMGFLCGHLLGDTEGFSACRIPMIASQVGYLALALEGWNAFFSSPFALLDFYLGLSSGESSSRVEEGIAQGQMIGFRREQDFVTVLNLFLSNPDTAIQYAMLADPNRAALFGLMASGGQAIAPPTFTLNFDEAALAQRISVDTPRVFTISATGTYGTATRTITAVADYNQDGRLLYWREF